MPGPPCSPGGQRDSFFEPKTCMCSQQLWHQLSMLAVVVVSGNLGSSVAGEQCPHISVFSLGREPCRHWAGMCHFRLFLLTHLSHRALLPCESLLLYHASHRTTRRSSISSFTSHLTKVPSACCDWGKNPSSYLDVWSPAYCYILVSTNILVLSRLSQEHRTDDLFGVSFFYKELILFHNGFYSFHIQRRYLSPNSELLNLSWLRSHSRMSCFYGGLWFH